jgi:hypothetical protein
MHEDGQQEDRAILQHSAAVVPLEAAQILWQR